ncbi:MAG: DUF2267 domain-containing protein [Endomicrobiales bacterium]
METTRGFESFDSSIQKTNLWLEDIMKEMGTEDRHKALIALRAVLHTLRDRLRLEEAVQLGAQLPLVVRGLYYEGWDPTDKPLKERHKEDLYLHIYDYFPNDPDLNPDKVIRSVFKVLSMHVTSGEIMDIIRELPVQLRDLWPELARK